MNEETILKGLCYTLIIFGTAFGIGLFIEGVLVEDMLHIIFGSIFSFVLPTIGFKVLEFLNDMSKKNNYFDVNEEEQKKRGYY